MRLKIKLKTNDSYASLNHNYALSGAIYKLLQFGSSEFANFLHEKGFKQNGHAYKLFTFSLKYEKYEIQNGAIKLNSPTAYLYISSPLIDSFVKNFVLGTFSYQNVEIVSENISTRFKIISAELIPEPTFQSELKFKLSSPMVISQSKLFNGTLSPYYFRITDDIKEINRIFLNNLINKFEIVNKQKYDGVGVAMNWDEDYIQAAIKKQKRLSKKISILKDIHNPIEIIGINCPFALKGDIELMKIGYECGFGEKNSMGFGMAEIIKN